VSRKLNFAILACAAALTPAALAQASSSVAPAPAQEPDLELIERPGTRFDRSLEAAALRVRYDLLFEQARRLEVEPETTLLARDATSESELRDGIRSLDERVDAARRDHRSEQAFAPSSGTIEGVSLATLNAIAACESGGDPTAVNPAGYYGKYQFDLGTWASVGGTGNPADASEAEQDYRAALLYSQAGSSPWPVCGQ
jgi:soluble lytic murein transglycosylase-like protein